MFPHTRRFLVIQSKSFDVVYEKEKTEGIRMGENGRDFRVLISF